MTDESPPTTYKLYEESVKNKTSTKTDVERRERSVQRGTDLEPDGGIR